MVRIDPVDLLPCDPMEENKRVQIKKIDTILALELPRDRVNNAFAKWPKADRSFMQSTMNLHCRSPIVVNIEVKKAAGVDPLGQLGIWSAAGFQKRLIDGDEEEGKPRIPMPGLAIVGNRWELHIAYRHPDGRVVRLPHPLVLFLPLSPSSTFLFTRQTNSPSFQVLAGPMEVGSTVSYVGIFQIINCLKVLTDWGLEEYNAWLEEVVWKRLEAGPNPKG